MTRLERTAVGFFHINNSCSYDDLTDNEKQFYSIDHALEKLPEIELSAVDCQKAKNGVNVILAPFNRYSGEFVRLKDPDGNLFAIGRAQSNIVSIERVLHLT